MEIKLSDRMKAVADMAKGSVVADIGCDHGMVSIYLVTQGGFKKAIAMDLREGPLKSARENIREHGLTDLIELRQSDGFESLEPGEADCAVLAGMGGMLMTDILKKGSCHTDKGVSLVLQPQSDYDVVRAYLESIDYIIADEAILIDEGKYYFVIKAESALGKVKPSPYTDEELLYGPVLLERKNTLLKTFLLRGKSKSEELFSTLQGVDTTSALERCESLKRELAITERALRRYDAL